MLVHSWLNLHVVLNYISLSLSFNIFFTIRPIKKASELKDYLEYMDSVAAQYNSPPDYPVTAVCKGIDGGANGTDILGRIFSGVIAYYGESRKCYDLNDFFSTDKLSAWDWQVMHMHLLIFFF